MAYGFRLLNCTLLIIDEISMVSSHTLLTVSAILQSLYKSELPFGGIARILCGDFYQLPPVANVNSGDSGEPIFAMAEVEKYIPHKVELVKVGSLCIFLGVFQ